MAGKYGPSRLNKFLGGLFCLSLWRKGGLCCNINCSCFNDVESPEAERHRAEAARWQYRSEKNAARQDRRAERAEKAQAKRDRKRRPEKKDPAADSGLAGLSATAPSQSTIPATEKQPHEISNSADANGQGKINRSLGPETSVREEDSTIPSQTTATGEASGANDGSTRESKEDRRKAKRMNKEQRRAKRKGSKPISPS